MMYLAYVMMTLHMFVGIFLIGLILLQRGRGGGLAGSFGGMGGQSAFGTKAGDIFTRITIGVAILWIVLACACILVVNAATNNTRSTFVNKDGDKAVITAPVDEKANAADPKLGEPMNGEKKQEDRGAVKDDGAAKASNAVEEGAAAPDVKPPGNSEARAAPAKPAAPEAKEPTPPKDGEQDKPANPESSNTKKPE